MESTQRGYPRTYRMDRSARRFFHGFALFIVVFFLGLTPLHLLHLIRNPIPPLSLTLIDIPVVAGAVWMSSRADRRVILEENSIEVAGWFGTRKLSRGEIRGRRMGKLPKRVGSSSFYIIVPADSGKAELKLPPLLHVDKCFFDWLETIPQVGSSQRHAKEPASNR